MSELTFTKSTDTEHEIKLDSTLISASWRNGTAVAGRPAKFEVITSFVGNGAKIKITGNTENGTKLGKISDTISNNVYVGEFDVPEDIDLDDEAYFEVMPEHMKPDVLKHIRAGRENIIVLRTFSKAYGLAGLRIGYAIGHPELIGLLNKVRQPFNVNAMAQAAAMAALEQRQLAARLVG